MQHSTGTTCVNEQSSTWCTRCSQWCATLQSIPHQTSVGAEYRAQTTEHLCTTLPVPKNKGYIQTAVNFSRHIRTHCTYIHLWQRAKKQEITTHSAHSGLLPCSTDMSPSRLPRAEYRVLTTKCMCKEGAQPVLTCRVRNTEATQKSMLNLIVQRATSHANTMTTMTK